MSRKISFSISIIDVDIDLDIESRWFDAYIDVTIDALNVYKGINIWFDKGFGYLLSSY